MATATQEKKAQPKPVEPIKTIDDIFEEQRQKAIDARLRNQPESNKPPRPMKRWLVTYDKREIEVSAPHRHDAWAKACDAWKFWPSPNSPKKSVVEVTQ